MLLFFFVRCVLAETTNYRRWRRWTTISRTPSVTVVIPKADSREERGCAHLKGQTVRTGEEMGGVCCDAHRRLKGRSSDRQLPRLHQEAEGRTASDGGGEGEEDEENKEAEDDEDDEEDQDEAGWI